MTPIVLILFDETDVDALPSDAMGAVNDLVPLGTLPPIVDAFTGNGRAITAGAAFVAQDITPGASLATRDLTIQMIVKWNFDLQVTTTGLGAVLARGKANVAAEYVSYGLDLRCVAPGIGEVRMWWQDQAGAVRLQPGGQFAITAITGFMLITATRRWISSTEAYLRYYVGGQIVGDFLTSDGSIGGGTTGTLTVGARYDGTGAIVSPFEGTIDQIRIFAGEMSGEEVEATWDRISRYQPDGYTTIRQLMPPGAPISNDPASRIQKLLRTMGHGLGFANAQIQNFRRNQLPARAYGEVLEEWETATKSTRNAADSIDRRRSRVVARLRQRAGSSPPGVRATVAELLRLAPSQLQILSFSNRRTDDFGSGVIDGLVWDPQPGGDFTGTATWSILAGGLRVLAVSGVNLRLDASYLQWATCFIEAQGNGRGVRHYVKMTPTTLTPNSEAGIAAVNAATNERVLFGVRNTGSGYVVMRELFDPYGVSAGVTVLAGTTLQTHWLSIEPFAGSSLSFAAPGGEMMRMGVSVVSQTAGYSTLDTSMARFSSGGYQMVGPYVRTFGGNTTGIDVTFDDAITISPYGDRPFRWYVLRDPALPGVPDLEGAEAALNSIGQAHTEAHVITALVCRCDDVTTPCDRTPMGAV